jgi:hypothetical protein
MKEIQKARIQQVEVAPNDLKEHTLRLTLSTCRPARSSSTPIRN